MGLRSQRCKRFWSRHDLADLAAANKRLAETGSDDPRQLAFLGTQFPLDKYPGLDAFTAVALRDPGCNFSVN
jgi:hypothetical protein